ncbi:polymer-forming cytoskeletal family protein [Leptospira fainei serovar Hurstbridge str. BUT 6]|uniref:Polymer-forming cytoskeletal family protein n=2 Tax=Leptospira fainei TaxID=48782 RepID=S3W786_9LEPT|nr:polymer-forming cytoskeletal family protein [Leptospira fainei serovar Hurstbridge str. BUT 6]
MEPMNEESIDTVIGDDIQFRGKLRFNNALKIKGMFKGTIETSGTLIVGETGQVEADVETGTLEVEGDLKGNINAVQKISVRKTGKVVGDVRTPDLEIESGAKFSGNCIM